MKSFKDYILEDEYPNAVNKRDWSVSTSDDSYNSKTDINKPDVKKPNNGKL